MEEAPFVPLYNLADIYGVAKNRKVENNDAMKRS